MPNPTPSAQHPTPRPLVGALPRSASIGLCLAGTLGVLFSFVIISTVASLTLPGHLVAISVITAMIVVIYSFIIRHYYLGWLHRRLSGQTPAHDNLDQNSSALKPAQLPATTAMLFIMAIISGWFAAQLAGAIIYSLTGSAGFDSYTASLNSPPAWQLLLLVLVTAPVSEELLLRGVAYPLLRSRFSTTASIIITTAIFGLIHANIVQFVTIVPLSVIAALLYEYTRQLRYPIAAHVLFNALGALLPVGIVNTIGSAGIWVTVIIATVSGLLCAYILKVAVTSLRGSNPHATFSGSYAARRMAQKRSET